MNTSNNNLVLSIDKNLVISTIEKQLSEAIIKIKLLKKIFILMIIFYEMDFIAILLV